MKQGDTICVIWSDERTKRNEYAIGLIQLPHNAVGDVYVLIKQHSMDGFRFTKWQCARATLQIKPMFIPTRIELIEKFIKDIK